MSQRFLFTCVRRATSVQYFSILHRRKPALSAFYSSKPALQETKSSSKDSSPPDLASLNTEDFTVFYRFPFIIGARFLARIKLYQTVMCVAALPPVTLLGIMGYVPLATVYTLWITGSFACVVLYASSLYTNRLIGIMSLSPDENQVKIGHLTFWGGRQNLIADVENIVPLSELSESPNEALKKVHTYSNPNNHLFLCIHYGGINDEKKFERVFGKISVR